MRVIKNLLAKELHKPLHMEARLLLLQCQRKMTKYKKSFPTKKITRPIAITSVL